MRVAIQGELGSFSHEAAQRFLPRARTLPCASNSQVFEALERGRAEAALIAIENSLAGSVTENMDLLLERRGFVEREFLLRVSHHLMAPPGVRLRDLRRVYSHPVALEQCRRFFRENRNLRPLPFYDTAGAAQHVMAERAADAAALAGRQAARVYGARVLRARLEDNPQNFTRFFLIRRRRRQLPGANKTSVVFALKNLPGALFKALSVFALREIDLAHIESRPVPGKPWQYVFYVDFLRGADPAAQAALAHLAEIAHFVKVLGVYPAAARSRRFPK